MLLDTELKIILLDQNNFVETLKKIKNNELRCKQF